MANMQVGKNWSPVRILEQTELARGGLNGNMNEQAKALAERTELLKDEKADKDYVDNLVINVNKGVQNFATEIELSQSIPSGTDSQFAYAWDTKKSFEYKNGQWFLTGLSEKDLANKNTLSKFNDVLDSTEDKIAQYAWSVADEENNIGMALGHDGSLEVAGAKQQKTDKQSDIVWAVADESENIGFSIHENSSISHGSINLSEGNVSAVVDEMGNVACVTDDAGITFYSEIHTSKFKTEKLTVPIFSCYEEGGDIYVVCGGKINKITSDGLNKYPQVFGTDVIFLSKKQGTYKQYIYSNGVIKRYHPNDAFLKFKHVVLTGQSLAWGPDTIIDGKMVSGQLCLGAERVFSYNESLGDPQPLQDKTNETIGTGFAVALNTVNEKILFSGCARGGRAYSAIKKNGTENIYENALKNIVRVQNIYDKKTYVPAILLIHGEQDGVEGRSDYNLCLKELINDYNADIESLTGQPSSAVLITCQTSSASGYENVANRDVFKTPLAQLKASNDYDDVFLVGPKYQYDYIDHAHYNKFGTRHHGEMIAKVYNEVVIKGNNWKPLQPTKFTVTGNKIVIDFYVPVAPLKFDSDYISQVENQGFELTKSGAAVIQNVKITSSNQVTITCSTNLPNGSVLSYAFYNGTYGKSGRTEGSRGTLKDSDNTSDIHGYMPLNNWCVSFKENLSI